MPPQAALSEWVKKAAPRKPRGLANRKRAIRVQHEFEFEPDTVTFHEIRWQVLGATSTLASALEKHDLPEAEKRKMLTKAFDTLDDFGSVFWNGLVKAAERAFELADRVVDLPVGPVTYQLRRPLKAQISPSAGHGWEFVVDQFGPRFIGKGDSIAAARRDSLSQIHSAFQSLVRLRPFQMDETQSADWQMLEKLIDVERYWDSVPVTLLETGVVSGVTAGAWEVVWLDGERREIIPIERTLPEFAAFEQGQWFESLVERQPKTYILQKLRYVKSIEPIREMSENDFREWVNSLPSGEVVPKSGTDWADL